jgi:hypothetical protein
MKQKGAKFSPLYDSRKCWAAIARQTLKVDPSINLSVKRPKIQKMFSGMGPMIKIGRGLRSGNMHVTAQSQGNIPQAQPGHLTDEDTVLIWRQRPRILEGFVGIMQRMRLP